jgi:DNA-binding NtrC family response regulator
MTLLYVDDNSPRLQALTARLALAGYDVLSASNGTSALEIFKKSHVDMAVVDYYMEDMGGDVVAVEMKRAKSDVPIIIFSGSFTLSEMVIALVDGFVYTGEDPEKLLDKIAQLLWLREQRCQSAHASLPGIGGWPKLRDGGDNETEGAPS